MQHLRAYSHGLYREPDRYSEVVSRASSGSGTLRTRRTGLPLRFQVKTSFTSCAVKSCAYTYCIPKQINCVCHATTYLIRGCGYPSMR